MSTEETTITGGDEMTQPAMAKYALEYKGIGVELMIDGIGTDSSAIVDTVTRTEAMLDWLLGRDGWSAPDGSIPASTARQGTDNGRPPAGQAFQDDRGRTCVYAPNGVMFRNVPPDMIGQFFANFPCVDQYDGEGRPAELCSPDGQRATQRNKQGDYWWSYPLVAEDGSPLLDEKGEQKFGRVLTVKSGFKSGGAVK